MQALFAGRGLGGTEKISSKYYVNWTSKFKKDYKLAQKRQKDISKLDAIISSLANGETLPPSNRDHALSGKWTNHRECHIAPDWLLVYQIKNDMLVLELTRTGSHADLF